MKTEVEKLTVAEALAQGYVHCALGNGERWQILSNISDLKPIDFEMQLYSWFIADKEAINPSIDEESIKDLVAEHIQCNWYDESGDDTEEVYNKVMTIDFKEITNVINEKLQSYCRYELTKIQLIP